MADSLQPYTYDMKRWQSKALCLFITERLEDGRPFFHDGRVCGLLPP